MILCNASMPIMKGDGVYLVDANGNKYIDAISSWWVNLHGHGNPYIAKKIYEQALALEHVIFAGFTHEPAVQLAERLLALLPKGFARVFYSDDGSTAVEVGLKMALQYWWNISNNQVDGPKNKSARTRILALENAYHGDTFGSMSISERGIFTLAFHDKLFDVEFIDIETFNLTSIPDPEEIACFIYEPLVQGAGGMIMHSPSSLERILEFCRKHGIICIADEVMTGFYRTGKMFASEYMQLQPDIICLSKGITGGTLAMGVTVCTNTIYDAYLSDDKLKTFFHGHSYTANPLSCAAALASLDLLEKKECLDNINKICAAHTQFIIDLKKTSTQIPTRNHRVLGTILAFEIDTGKDEYLNEAGKKISANAFKKAIFLRPLGNTIYVMTPYVITPEQLSQVYSAIIELLNEN